MPHIKILETISNHTMAYFQVRLSFDNDASKFEVTDIGIGNGKSLYSDFEEALSFYRALVFIGENRVMKAEEGSA